MAWEALQADMSAGLVAAGYDDLCPRDAPLLRRVLHEGLRPGELATRLELSKQAVDDLLREFEARGYITLECARSWSRGGVNGVGGHAARAARARRPP